MNYIVTGTPGTGKTTFAKKYAQEHNLTYVDGKEIIRKHSLVESFDEKRDCEVIDEHAFAKVCEEIIKTTPGVVIDSHLSQYINPEYVDKCFVTTCGISELKTRLEERNYNEKKIRENLDAEIFKICQIDAQDEGHTVEVISTDS